MENTVFTLVMGQVDTPEKTETRKYIIWLREARPEHSSRLGSKAINLARLLQAGYPVPEGFCITLDAYFDFLRRLGQPIHADMSIEDLSRIVLSSRLGADLHSEVLAAYQLLGTQYIGERKVAVRSSASAEDTTVASFAGQYTSVMNVENEFDLFQAVKVCWASSFSPQVQAYQTRSGQGDEREGMAVIVQKMIPAEWAGVLFTTDPRGEDKNRMIFEAGTGPGMEVVSGTRSGVHITANKQSLDIVDVDPPGEGSVELLPDHVDWGPLLKMSVDIEDLMGGPQDIEWAFSRGQFWILQSRPITGILGRGPRQIWSRANAGEIMPGVVSPLTWSVFKPVLQAAGQFRARSPLTIHWRWRHPCGNWPDTPRLFRGRAYMELASVYAGFGSMPGVTPEVLQRILGFEFDCCKKEELPERKPRWHIMDPYRFLRFWLEMCGMTKSLSGQARKWMDGEESIKDTNLRGLSDAASEGFWVEMEQLLEESSRILGLHIQCTSMAFSTFGLLDRLLRKHLEANEVQEFEAGLIADFQAISTVQQTVALWDLAQAARDVPAIRHMFLQGEPADRGIETLIPDPSTADFINLWRSFLGRFGDRGTQEFELAVAHWAEDPTFIMKTIQQIIEYELPDPRKRLNDRHRNGTLQSHAIDQLLRSRGCWKDAWFFRRLIKAYKEFVPLRENLKYCVVSRFHTLRKVFITLGKVLEKRGLLSEWNDIFFLRYKEIDPMLRQSYPGERDIHDLIIRRKEEQKKYLQSPVSDLWIDVEGREIPMELPTRQGSDVLKGIGCSPGVITGQAHVLTSIPGNSAVPPGCILVVPSIDPGLTPLFLTAAGLVTEIGGALSHGATVAREYGLPAVVGVPHATRVIQNGQQIQVDGFRGRVHLISGGK